LRAIGNNIRYSQVFDKFPRTKNKRLSYIFNFLFFNTLMYILSIILNVPNNRK